MKELILALLIMIIPFGAKADFWGGDLPLLAQIVTNTLKTIAELEKQTNFLRDEMDGVRDRINRIRTIADVVQPANWNQWKDPNEALRRLRLIYYTLPKEYQSEKSQAIEEELTKAMNLIAKVSGESSTTFYSGKELERKGADASPAVAQKLTASGVGTLVSMESQSQVIQSHIISLLTQILAEANEKESRMIVSKGTSFNDYSDNLGTKSGWFSEYVTPLSISPWVSQ